MVIFTIDNDAIKYEYEASIDKYVYPSQHAIQWFLTLA